MPPIARPLAVTILGWVFAVFSGMGVLGSVFVLLFWSLLSPTFFNEFPSELPPDFPPAFGLLFGFFRYYVAIGILQTVVAGFSVFAAIQFLKLRPWSRAYFEVLSWIRLSLGTLFIIVFSVGWISAVTSISTSSGEPMPPPAVFIGFGVAITTMIMLFNGVILGGLIWLLRSKHVRPAFLSTPPAT